MTITVGTPVKAQSFSAVTSLTYTGFTVGSASQLLLVWIFHEGGVTLTDTSVKFGGTDLTKILEVKQTSGNQAGITVWGLANPAATTADIVANISYASDFTFQAMLVSGADLSSGLASAINDTGSFQTAGSGTTMAAAIDPTVSGTLIMDAAMVNDGTMTLTASAGQATVVSELVTGGTGFSYKIGKKDGGAAGSYTQGYTCSGSYARASYGAIAIKSAAATLLSDLSFTATVSNIVPGEPWSASISGRTSGSAITASCAEEPGAVTWNAGSNTLSATFSTPGTKTITLTETLAGASNSPHVSPTQSATVLTQVKIAVLGSSTADFWFSNTFNTTETPNARLRVGNGGAWSTFAGWAGAGKGPGGIAFGNHLLGQLGTGYRVDMLDCGLGGTWLSGWANHSGAEAAAYDALVAAINAVGGVSVAVCHVGSNDARAEGIPSRAQHEANYRALIGNLRSAVSHPTLPFFIMGCPRSPDEPTIEDAGDSAPYSDIYWTRARGAELNVADDAHVYTGYTGVDLPLYGDNVHLSEGHDGGNAIGARRCAFAVYNTLFGGTQRHTGPRPGASSYDAATGWITIGFAVASGFELVGKTAQSGLTGFRFFAGSAAVSPVTAPFVSGPAQVAARLAPGLSNVSYSYQETVAPDISNGVYDNGPIPVEP